MPGSDLVKKLLGGALLVGGSVLAYQWWTGRQLLVKTGETVGVVFTWRNASEYILNPEFMLQIKGSGGGWEEGDWVESPPLYPGETSSELTATVTIPTLWDAGAEIEVELKARISDVSPDTFRVKYWRYPFKIEE